MKNTEMFYRPVCWFSGYTHKIDYDAPVKNWGCAKSDVGHLFEKLSDGKKLLRSEYSYEEQEVLKDLLLEVFSRQLPHSFLKILGIIFTFDQSFAKSALVEAAREGSQMLLKHSLPLALEQGCLPDMIVASLLGNNLDASKWIIGQTPCSFSLSQDNLQEIVKKSPPQQVRVLALCVQYGDCMRVTSAVSDYCKKREDHPLFVSWQEAQRLVLMEAVGAVAKQSPRRKM